jgi:hypothetical protein
VNVTQNIALLLKRFLRSPLSLLKTPGGRGGDQRPDKKRDDFGPVAAEHGLRDSLITPPTG